jgi:uncharacterized protein (TIGR00290 family)
MQTTHWKKKKSRRNPLYFGDINLEDLRKYREDKLATMGLEGVFPLWKVPTYDLIQEFIALGFKTIVVCVNERYLDKSFIGRVIDQNFINDLPENVDVCGENGEFHTFTLMGLFSQNRLILKLAKSCIVNTKNQRGFLKHGL